MPLVDEVVTHEGLVVDIGGTNVKILASGEAEPRKFPSGPKMTPQQMVAAVKQPAPYSSSPP